MIIRRMIGALIALTLSACVASTGEDFDTLGGSDAEAIGTVQEALTKPQFFGKWSSTSIVTCPGSHPHALGSGSQSVRTGEDIRRHSYPSSSQVEARASTGTPTDLHTYAICSNVAATTVTNADTDGSVTDTCPEGMIAVGGGGACATGGKRMYRTRPSPDIDGSIPTGWTWSCDGGTVLAYARCLDPDNIWDFTTCRTQRNDASDTPRGDIACPSGQIASAIGGYCGGGNMWAIGSGGGDSLADGVVWCDARGNVNAYAICCSATGVKAGN